MLYNYPISAAANNWLHETLSQILVTVHGNINASRVPLNWPDDIPMAYKSQLSSRTGLRDRIETYSKALARLSVKNRNKVFECITSQNQIQLLVSNVQNCDTISDLPKSIRKAAIAVFSFSFGLLTDLGIRDEHYTAVFNADTNHICPFCGCEYFDAPGAPREDLDHYLAKSIYPFAAANLVNLVPMGVKCNEKYKLAQNILIDSTTSTRRKSFFPYGGHSGSVSLANSIPFAGNDHRLPLWQVDLLPASPECETWDAVFQIRTRYTRDVLNPMFFEWLRIFTKWFQQRFDSVSDSDILNALKMYIENLHEMGMEGVGREFLRIPVFEMLYKYCQLGHARLINFLRVLVSPST